MKRIKFPQHNKTDNITAINKISGKNRYGKGIRRIKWIFHYFPGIR